MKVTCITHNFRSHKARVTWTVTSVTGNGDRDEAGGGEGGWDGGAAAGVEAQAGDGADADVGEEVGVTSANSVAIMRYYFSKIIMIVK